MHLRAGVLHKLIMFADMQNQVPRAPWVDLFALSLPGPMPKTVFLRFVVVTSEYMYCILRHLRGISNDPLNKK